MGRGDSCPSAVARMIMLAALAIASLARPAGAICKSVPQGTFLSDPKITIQGSQTLVSFGSGFRPGQGAMPGVEGPWLAPVITAFVLFGLAAWGMATRPNGSGLFYCMVVAVYPIMTGVVELVRANWDSSRFGFLTASWHNFPEYYMILANLRGDDAASCGFSGIMLWVWVLNVFIMFVPSLDGRRSGLFFAGLLEQLTGICCDHLLMCTFMYLWYTAPRGSDSKRAYGYGLVGATLHMLEIGPLVVLLLGLVPRPSVHISALVALTTPITFWFYIKFAKGCPVQVKGTSPIAARPARVILAVGIVLGLLTILAPPALLRHCPGSSLLPEFNTAWPRVGVAVETCPASGLQRGSPTRRPSEPPRSNADSPANHTPPQTEPVCPSSLALTGSTTVTARPGRSQDLVSFVASMPGPVREEDGCLGYDMSYDGNGTVRFSETWSSIRTLYKHMLLSPTVRRVFYSPGWNQIKAHQKLDGPFQAMLPCSTVSSEPEPVEYVFSVELDAPLGCVWDRISDWSNDVTWIQGATDVTALTPNMRVVHMQNGVNLTETRQVRPLPGVDQPEGGYRLVYHVLDGWLIPEHAETYKGEITLQPVARKPGKTVYSYRATVTPRNASQAVYVYKTLSRLYTNVFPQSLAAWAQSLTCQENPEYYYQFILPPDFPKYSTAAQLVSHLTGNETANPPMVRFAANVWTRYSEAGRYLRMPNLVKTPDFAKEWNAAVALEFPPGCTVSPDDVGRGVTLDIFRLRVKSRPLPLADDVRAVCEKALPEENVGNANATDAQLMLLASAMAAADASPNPPLMYEDPVSGQNLNKYKTGHGRACYHLYLIMVMKLFRPTHSVIQYYAEVVKSVDIPEEEQWDEIVIPTYTNSWALYTITNNESYKEDFQVMLAGLADTVNYGFDVLPGVRPTVV